MLSGIDEHADWNVETVTLFEGDRLLVFTDGLTETFCQEETLFGRDRVLSLLSRTAEATPSAAVDTIVQTLEAFRSDGRQIDDITIVMIDFTIFDRSRRELAAAQTVLS